MAGKDLALDVLFQIMKTDKGGEFHSFPHNAALRVTLLPGWISSLASQDSSITTGEICFDVSFLVTLTLTQSNVTFFLRIRKAEVATGNPQSVNTVNCFFLGA